VPRADAGPLRVALAAPTGKAAARLVESIAAGLPGLPVDAAIAAVIPRRARTVHRSSAGSRARPRASGTTPSLRCRWTSWWSTRRRWSTSR
jgi:hypothetical protein